MAHWSVTSRRDIVIHSVALPLPAKVRKDGPHAVVREEVGAVRKGGGARSDFCTKGRGQKEVIGIRLGVGVGVTD